ncbi:MAG TPA: hypothetical protein VKS81_05145 [Bacteroidota bacterium]|nr:hypothetical protein [Bacteroidota bacterium]
MKHILLNCVIPPLVAVWVSLLFSSCGTISNLAHPGTKYEYHYTMISPSQDDRMIFRDTSIYVQFRFDDSSIKFQLQNVSTASIEIVWPRAAIGIRNKYSGVRDSKTLYDNSSACAGSTILPPLAYAVDFAVPEKNVYYDGSWHERDLLPTTDRGTGESRDKIMSLVGTPVSFILPIKVGGVNTDYTFTFAVTSIDPISWDHYKPAKRPAPPAREKEQISASQYITAGIVATLVGVSAILLTQKKTAPTE